MYKAYIQAHIDKKGHTHFQMDGCYQVFETLKHWYTKKQYGEIPVIFFEIEEDGDGVDEEIKQIPLSKNNIVIGSVESTMAYLSRLGVHIPPPMNIPYVLRHKISRFIEVMPISTFLETNLCPCFVKPHDRLKGCVSGVIKEDVNKKFVLQDAPDDIEVMVSSVINIRSEYRTFINRGKIVDIRRYNIGDPLVFPDMKYVKECLELMNEKMDTPISYTMDFAVLHDGSTEVIECNDGWSVGSYGFEGFEYFRFLLDRWKQLTKNI